MATQKRKSNPESMIHLVRDQLQDVAKWQYHFKRENKNMKKEKKVLLLVP